MKKRRGADPNKNETCCTKKELLRLSEYVKAICRCSEYGGRVVAVCDSDNSHERDEEHVHGIDSSRSSSSGSMTTDQVLLLDIGEWTDDMAMCVAHRFPGVQIEVRQSRCSLTGFCVAMTLFQRQHARSGNKGGMQKWSMWCMLILVVLFFFAMAAVFVSKHFTYFIDGIDFNI